MADIPKITFNNGKQIPILGLGTWKVSHNLFRVRGSFQNHANNKFKKNMSEKSFFKRIVFFFLLEAEKK